MTNLTKVETNTGIEIYIENTTGECFTSISGYARMANLSKQAVSLRCDRLLTVNQMSLKSAEILTTQGLRTVKLIPEKIIAQWLSKDNLSMAQDLMLLGVRKFLHTMAGFKPEADTPAPVALTRKEMAKLWFEAEEKAERLSVELDHAVEQITVMEPKAKLAEKFITDDGLTTISDFAKDMAKKGIGRNTVYKMLRDRRVLDTSNRPYQYFVNSGYFVLKPTGVYIAYGNVCQQYTTYLTPKGVQWALEALEGKVSEPNQDKR